MEMFLCIRPIECCRKLANVAHSRLDSLVLSRELGGYIRVA